MPDALPSLSAQKVIRALNRLGFAEDRQKGSHVILYNARTERRVVVPVHKGKDIKKPLLRKIITHEAQVSIEEFLREI